MWRLALTVTSKGVFAGWEEGAVTVTLSTCRSASANTGRVASADLELFVGLGSETAGEEISTSLAKVKVWKLGVVHSSVKVLSRVTSPFRGSDAGVS